YAGVLCTLLGLPIVIEACEWLPGHPGRPKYTNWLYRQVMFRFCVGAIVISYTIEKRIKELDVYRKRPFPIYKRTVLVDPLEFARDHEERKATQQTLVWCGMVTGYLKDVLFLTT